MKKFLIISLMCVLSSCVSGLNSYQKSELREVKNNRPDLYVEEKNPGTGVALGFILGGGSFYSGHIGTGIASLILWPFSILWDPINGYNGAMQENYYATKYNYKRLKDKGEVKENFF